MYIYALKEYCNFVGVDYMKRKAQSLLEIHAFNKDQIWYILYLKEQLDDHRSDRS